MPKEPSEQRKTIHLQSRNLLNRADSATPAGELNSHPLNMKIIQMRSTRAKKKSA
jgi:hypothetical protein